MPSQKNTHKKIPIRNKQNFHPNNFYKSTPWHNTIFITKSTRISASTKWRSPLSTPEKPLVTHTHNSQIEDGNGAREGREGGWLSFWPRRSQPRSRLLAHVSVSLSSVDFFRAFSDSVLFFFRGRLTRVAMRTTQPDKKTLKIPWNCYWIFFFLVLTVTFL